MSIEYGNTYAFLIFQSKTIILPLPKKYCILLLCHGLNWLIFGFDIKKTLITLLPLENLFQEH